MVTKKYYLPVTIVSTLIAILFFFTTIPKIQASTTTGVSLDIARRYYSVKDIEKYVDLLAGKNAYLQLHLSDDTNYSIESKQLNQTTTNNAQYKNGVWYNLNTKQPFLSDYQLKELVTYANKKHVPLIPDLDSPGHMGGIKALLGDNSIGNDIHSNQFDSTTNQTDITFMENLYKEVLQKFPYSKQINLGGDEYATGGDHIDFVNYMNTLSTYINKLGVKTSIWNDTLTLDTYKHLNKNISILYWLFPNHDGLPHDTNTVPMQDLINAGYKVYNYNDYYLYFLPSPDNIRKDNLNYTINDLKTNFTNAKWNSDTREKVKGKVQGSAISIWSEESKPLTTNQIFKATKPIIQTLLNKNKQ